MDNVINLFTRKAVHVSLVSNCPIDRLAARFNTTRDRVIYQPRPKLNNKDQLVIRTYRGNVHTMKIPHHNEEIGASMPIPVNIKKYLDFISCNGVENIILDDECFMHMDRKYKRTLELLKRLQHVGLLKVITVRTRSDLFAHDQYLDLFEKLQRKDIELNFELYGMSLNERENKIKWPGAPSVLRRKKALGKALDRLKLRLKIV